MTAAETKEVNDTWGEAECPECDGHGDVDVDSWVETCPVCNGQKTVPVKLEVKETQPEPSRIERFWRKLVE